MKKQELQAAPRLRLLLSVVLSGLALAALAGCGFTGSAIAVQGPVALHGTVRGGQEPVSGASVQLYAAGTSGTGSAAHPLLSSPVRTDSNGNFSIPASYYCPSASSQVYLIASNGTPGAASGANPALALAAMLGSCGSLSASTPILVNEVTTVGSVWPLASYMTSPMDLGSAAGDAAFLAAGATIGEFINIGNGTSPGIATAESYFAENSKLYSLADVLDKCVDSPGGSAGDGSPCGLLFSMATPSGGSAPTDTLSAAMHIAQNPYNNVTGIFGLVAASTAFQPTLTAAPPDWTLALSYPVATPSISLATGTYLGNQEVSISDATAGSKIYCTTDGTVPTTSSPVYSAPLTIAASSTVQAIAMWNGSQSAVASSTLTIIAAQPATRLVFLQQPSNAFTGAEISPAVSVAVEDASGNIVTSAANRVTVNLAGVSGLGGTLQIAARSGIAIFSNLTVNTAGKGYILAASSPGLASSNSTSFNVTSPGINLSLPSSSITVGSTLTGSVTLGLPAGPSGISLTLASSSANDVSVSPSVVNIAAGQSAGSFTVRGIAAGASTISASAAGYSPASALITAVPAAPVTPSQTATQLVFLQQPSNAFTGAAISPAVRVAVEDAGGNIVPSANNNVTVNLVGIGLGGTLQVAAQSGIATFSNLTVSTAGKGYTLAVSSPGLLSSTSTSFSVTSPGISLSLPSSSITVGSTLAGSVTLGQPAGPGAVNLTLASSSVNDVSVSPSTMVIPAGQSTGSFTVNGIAAGASTLSASAVGYTSASTQVAVAAAAPVTTAASVTTIEALGAIPASQAVNGLGFNITPGNNWEFQMAAAAGATHARYQCSWVTTENQTAPPNNTTASPQFTLQSDCQAGLASAANYGIHSTILAAYGSPYHQILTVTVPNGAAAGATQLDVAFASGVGGDTLSSMAPIYDTIINSSNVPITNKHSYAGGLITGVTLTNSTHATLTLASALSSALPANTTTQYFINQYLYPPPASFSPTDPSVLAYAKYAEFLASQISVSGVTGEVEIWNEPPWIDDPWDDRYDFYDNQPIPVSPGPKSPSLPDWGFPVALYSQTSLASGVTYNWGGTEKTGFNSMLNAQMLANTGVSFLQPNNLVTTESFHPYGNNPEDALWSQPCLQATINPSPAAASSYSSCNLLGVGPNFAYAAQETLVQRSINPAWGIGHNITETGFQGSSGDDAHKARFIMRQFLGYQAAGVTPIEFYRLYDTSNENYGFVNSTANADGTHSPLPAYTAIAGLMSDLDKIKLSPVTPYAAQNLPSIVSYSGTYPLDTVSLVGSRAGDSANSILFTVWQRSFTSGVWGTLASPAPAPVTVKIPAGVNVVAVINLGTRAVVPYTTSGQQVTFDVSDDPVEVLVEP